MNREFHRWLATWPVWLIGLTCWPLSAGAENPFRMLDTAADNVSQAVATVHTLQNRDDIELLDVLSAMKGKSAVAKNWYLSLAQSIADRDPASSVAELQQFLPRLSEDSSARYWAFLYLTRGNDQLREEMLESMLADPCLELRYEAVAQQFDRLQAQSQLSDEQQINAYRELLAAARLPEQVQQVAGQLEKLGQPVDLLKHFGFLPSWQTIGPFDNVNQSAFDVVYPPEADYLAGKLTRAAAQTDAGKTYAGKTETVAWQSVRTEQADGAIDLNAAYDNAKGAIVYALTEFKAADALDCEVRIGSPNAVKVWVNGQPAISREVYHAGGQIDQYVAPVKLQPGVNSILVKVCQNEQTDSWAQDWNFQLRFTDSSGLAISAAPTTTAR